MVEGEVHGDLHGEDHGEFHYELDQQDVLHDGYVAFYLGIHKHCEIWECMAWVFHAQVHDGKALECSGVWDQNGQLYKASEALAQESHSHDNGGHDDSEAWDLNVLHNVAWESHSEVSWSHDGSEAYDELHNEALEQLEDGLHSVAQESCNGVLDYDELRNVAWGSHNEVWGSHSEVWDQNGLHNVAYDFHSEVQDQNVLHKPSKVLEHKWVSQAHDSEAQAYDTLVYVVWVYECIWVCGTLHNEAWVEVGVDGIHSMADDNHGVTSIYVHKQHQVLWWYE